MRIKFISLLLIIIQVLCIAPNFNYSNLEVKAVENVEFGTLTVSA